MENASKALLMAGGVLIGILILSLAAYLFVDFGSTSAEIHRQNEEKQITEFNSKFTSYEGYKDKDGNWQITIYDIITLAEYAKENNTYNKGVTEEQIIVQVNGRQIQSNNNEQNQNLIREFINDGTLIKFKCDEIKYNSRGKVKLIAFSQSHS